MKYYSSFDFLSTIKTVKLFSSEALQKQAHLLTCLSGLTSPRPLTLTRGISFLLLCGREAQAPFPSCVSMFEGSWLKPNVKSQQKNWDLIYFTSFHKLLCVCCCFLSCCFLSEKDQCGEFSAKGRGLVTGKWHLFSFAPLFVYFTLQLLRRNTQRRERQLLKRSNSWGGSWKRQVEKGSALQENKKIVPASVGCREERTTW